MTQFAITVTENQAAMVHQEGILTAGMTGAAVTVTFDKAWEGLQRLAVFRCDETVVDVPMAGDTVTVPPKALSPDETLYLGLYGTDGEETVIPTVWVSLGLVCDAADPSGDTDTDPTLPIWAQLQAQIDQQKIPEDVLRSNPQTLNAAQQAQARANLAAASQTEVEALGEEMDSLGITPITSKNLFDVNAVSEQGQWVAYNTGKREFYPDNKYIPLYHTSGDISVEGGKTYTWSGGGSNGNTSLHSYAVYDRNGAYITGKLAQYFSPEPLALTMPDNAGFLVANLYNGNNMYWSTIQFELGTEATDYEPYGTVGSKLTGAKIPNENILYGSGSLLRLPKQYHLVVGDTFELFYKGVMLCKDPYRYNILVTCDMGNAYQRKYVATPAEAGTHTLKIAVTDDFGNVIDTQSTQLVVSAKMASPASNINVLCLGDSLTAGGAWVDEAYRRLTKTGTVTQHNAAAPTGDGLSNITFVGKKTTANGAGYEGTGGWRYSHYIDASNADNPFVYDGTVDFTAYCSDLGIAQIDQCYVLLGWNMAGVAEANWKADAKAFIDLLIAHNSAIKIVLMGLQIPAYDGLGANYGATGVYADYRALQEYVFRVDRMNRELAADYPNNVSSISIAGQFDTENNMPTTTTTPNIRSTAQEKRQSNGVHPASAGYYQIADAVYRQFHNG